jgi:hypothetical protein
MALSDTTELESAQILRAFCHVDEPDIHKYTAFLDYYRNEACVKGQDNDLFLVVNRPALGTHQAIWHAALALRSWCTRTKEQFQDDILPPGVAADEKERCTRMLVKLTFMIDCASSRDHSMRFKLHSKDGFPTIWLSDQSFVDFFDTAFPITTSSEAPPLRISDIVRCPKAWKLQNRHGIRIVATNDLVQHLFYDKASRTLRIFHQVAYLKAHLRHATASRWSDSVEENIKR